ncbi:MAG TPA: phosphoglycerate dehydrogenase [Vicinamibacterales bacterium]|nr:phosphoglycerate dehydrogenase [Vicinamibacterales bacterium]
MNIVVADQLPASAIELLRSVTGWTVDARPQRKADQLALDLAEADAIIVRSATTVDRALIAAAPRLRVIARAGTGVDNVDVEAATERGILVMNAPGANSVSVAELAMALMLTLSRGISAADAAMKKGVWDKKRLVGAELRGKTLGIVGLGRIGQEVATRARGFGMTIVAHDPFISEQVAAGMHIALLTVDELCAQSDYITLHVPVTPETRHLINKERLAQCKPGVRIVNTARGELIDEEALADAIEAGAVAGAGLDVFQNEPPGATRLIGLRQVVATPHIAASTVEAQELVGIETAAAVRDYLQSGTIANAVNFPSVRGDDAASLRPFMTLADRMGELVSQLVSGRTHGLGIRYYGTLLAAHGPLVTSAAVAGTLRPILSESVTVVNARAVAAQRGIEIVESSSSRPRDFTNLLSLKLQTTDGERWVEGTVFEPGSPRLTLVDGVEVEAPLEGTLLVIHNEDLPGVIGEVGTILGRHSINIAGFSLGRGRGGAVGVVNLDLGQSEGSIESAVKELRGVPAIRQVCVVRLT